MKLNFRCVIIIAVVQCIILNSTNLLAQKVNYTILKDNPSDVPKLHLMISPIYLSMSKMSLAEAGFGFGAHYDLNDKMGFSAFFHKPYIPSASVSYHSTVVNNPVINLDDNNFSKPKFLDLTYRFCFVDTESKGSTNITLSSNSSGKKTYTSSIMVKATNRKKLTARSGVFHYNGFYNSRAHGKATGTNAINGFTLRAEDGSILEHSYHKVGLSFSSLSIYGGISMQKINNVLIKTDKFGIKGKQLIHDVYFDFLYAPLISTEELVYNNQSYNILGREDNMLHKMQLGWRLGWEMIRLGKALDMGMKVEVGSRPGINGLGLFWDNHFYMVINTMKKKAK
jgi:hypothetical protein